MKLLLLLLLASCSSYQGKTYVYTTKVKVLGVKCAQDYFFSYELGKCTVIQREAPTDEVSSSEAATRIYTPSGVSMDEVRTYQASPERFFPIYKRPRRPASTKGKGKAKVEFKDQCRILLNKGEL